MVWLAMDGVAGGFCAAALAAAMESSHCWRVFHCPSHCAVAPLGPSAFSHLMPTPLGMDGTDFGLQIKTPLAENGAAAYEDSESGDEMCVGWGIFPCRGLAFRPVCVLLVLQRRHAAVVSQS